MTFLVKNSDCAILGPFMHPPDGDISVPFPLCRFVLYDSGIHVVSELKAEILSLHFFFHSYSLGWATVRVPNSCLPANADVTVRGEISGVDVAQFLLLYRRLAAYISANGPVFETTIKRSIEKSIGKELFGYLPAKLSSPIVSLSRFDPVTSIITTKGDYSAPTLTSNSFMTYSFCIQITTSNTFVMGEAAFFSPKVFEQVKKKAVNIDGR